MDIRRIVIYAGLAISSYLLFYNWNQEYGSENLSTEQVAETATDSNVASQTNNLDLPDTSVAAVEDGDAPDVTEQPGITAADVPEVAAPSGNVITVQTDVMTVQINPKGGQVVSVQ